MVPTIPIGESITPAVHLDRAGRDRRRSCTHSCCPAPSSASRSRPPGLNPSAAVASGISAKKMAVSAMLISGAVAGLVGMPELLNGPAAQYSHQLPGRARLHRYRHRAARSQQSGRHGLRRAAVVGAGQFVQRAAGRRRAEPARDDHAGHHRAVGGHRLRDSCADTGWCSNRRKWRAHWPRPRRPT